MRCCPCSPPLEMLSHFSPLAPFFGIKGDFALCGGRPKTASPFMAVVQTYPQKRSTGTFLTKQFLHGFVHIIQLSFLFRQTEAAAHSECAAAFCCTFIMLLLCLCCVYVISHTEACFKVCKLLRTEEAVKNRLS